MDWQTLIKGFSSYMLLERSFSKHSIKAYIQDVTKLSEFMIQKKSGKNPLTIIPEDLHEFIQFYAKIGLETSSQARMLSGLRAFFKFLLLENLIEDDPTDLLEGPKLHRKIPDVLTIAELEQVLGAVDLSHPQGQRNRAILETLYSCGLRVSELINLKLSNYYPEIGYVRVIGKNDKERVIPIGGEAMKQINFYIDAVRNHISKIDPSSEDVLFLNRRGKQLTRVMIFTIVKNTVKAAGIDKVVSPHTFRHSFATHLVQGGADLKAVQDMLGHESITTTEIYTHLDTGFLRETLMLYHPRNKTAKQNV